MRHDEKPHTGTALPRLRVCWAAACAKEPHPFDSSPVRLPVHARPSVPDRQAPSVRGQTRRPERFSGPAWIGSRVEFSAAETPSG